MPEYFIFEIKKLEASYSLSINSNHQSDEGPYNEHMSIEFDAKCIYPKKFDGVMARVDVVGKRDCLEPKIYQNNSDWKPRCVGCLELSPAGGRFYISVPHESMSFILDALTHNMFRFLSLWGPPLKRGKSLCLEFRFIQSINLEDY